MFFLAGCVFWRWTEKFDSRRMSGNWTNDLLVVEVVVM